GPSHQDLADDVGIVGQIKSLRSNLEINEITVLPRERQEISRRAAEQQDLSSGQDAPRTRRQWKAGHAGDESSGAIDEITHALQLSSGQAGVNAPLQSGAPQHFLDRHRCPAATLAFVRRLHERVYLQRLFRGYGPL